MSIWKTLGIEPTSDTSVIRKAYAKKLRQHHPEEDPEGYQQLREAYDDALEQAKWHTEESLQDDDDSLEEESWEYETAEVDETPLSEQREDYDRLSDAAVFSGDDDADDLDDERTDWPAFGEDQDIAEFIQRVHALYSDFHSRIEPASWDELLNSDIVWDVERSEQLQNALLAYLEDHRYLPRSVWQRMDDMFHWSEKKDELLEEHSYSFIEYVMLQISGSAELGYDCLRNLPDSFEFDRYLELREDAMELMMIGRMDLAGRNLEEAHAMFAEDPDLKLLRGKHDERTGDAVSALACYEAALALRPDDLEAHWLTGMKQFEQGHTEEALKHFEIIREAEPDNADAANMARRCHNQLGDEESMARLVNLAGNMNNTHMATKVHVALELNRHNRGPLKFKKLIMRTILGMLSFFLLLFLRLNWLFLFFYAVLELLFDVPPAVTAVLGAILLWNAWKSFRVVTALK